MLCNKCLQNSVVYNSKHHSPAYRSTGWLWFNWPKLAWWGGSASSWGSPGHSYTLLLALGLLQVSLIHLWPVFISWSMVGTQEPTQTHSTFEASDDTTPTDIALAKASHVTKVCRGGTYVCPGEGHWLQICQLSQWGCQNSPPLTIRCQTFEYNANCYKIRLPNLLEALSHKINKNNVREQFRSHTDTSLWHHLLSIEEKSNIDHDTITNSKENCLNIRERPLGKLIYTFA